MSELRYNLISREWVIIATERAKRPKDFVNPAKEKKSLAAYKDNCPFCPGNEINTPDETFRLSDERGWRTRSIYNKFGALTPDQSPERQVEGINHSMGGFGHHEVIIEHPLHNTIIALMDQEDVLNIIKAYKSRYLSLQQDKRVEHIVIFKNHGAAAGTSLEHPHSQLIATPIVPPQARNRVEQAVNYFDVTGKCIFCHSLEDELSHKKRVVAQTDKFVSFIPYAALSPFMTWIFPRRHMPSFADINDDEMYDLAAHLKMILAKFYYCLDDPDFNFTIRSIPVHEKGEQYFHWYITVILRINQPAGFELGSGIFINVALPEESAEFLRQARCQSGE